MKQQQEQKQEKQRSTLYWLNMRFGTYTGISFVTALSIIFPHTAYVGLALIILFLIIMCADTFRVYTNFETGGYHNRALRKAIASHAHDFAFLAFAITVGIFIGVGV